MQEYEIVILKSGKRSLRSVERAETFHPVTGPWVEANVLHVGQQRLLERAQDLEKFVIWDVGFGAGANALAAIHALSEGLSGVRGKIEIHSFDRTTSAMEFAMDHSEELEYPSPYLDLLDTLLQEKRASIGDRIQWHLHLGDFREQMLKKDLPSPHSIFYDPYSAVGNPEMWSLEHFKALRDRLDDNIPFLLTNYTRSTSVRATLLLAGFYVGVGCVVGEKAETTVASNCLELLENPLTQQWLNRVRQSTNSAPLRNATYSKSPISEQDFEELQRLSQFSGMPSQASFSGKTQEILLKEFS